MKSRAAPSKDLEIQGSFSIQNPPPQQKFNFFFPPLPPIDRFIAFFPTCEISPKSARFRSRKKPSRKSFPGTKKKQRVVIGAKQARDN